MGDIEKFFVEHACAFNSVVGILIQLIVSFSGLACAILVFRMNHKTENDRDKEALLYYFCYIHRLFLGQFTVSIVCIACDILYLFGLRFGGMCDLIMLLFNAFTVTFISIFYIYVSKPNYLSILSKNLKYMNKEKCLQFLQLYSEMEKLLWELCIDDVDLINHHKKLLKAIKSLNGIDKSDRNNILRLTKIREHLLMISKDGFDEGDLECIKKLNEKLSANLSALPTKQF